LGKGRAVDYGDQGKEQNDLFHVFVDVYNFLVKNSAQKSVKALGGQARFDESFAFLCQKRWLQGFVKIGPKKNRRSDRSLSVDFSIGPKSLLISAGHHS
jgi:hypothetical protein